MPFSDIVGHEGTIGVLQRSLARNKIAHAYIFEGIEGCGKKKTAQALVEALFCGKEEACGECSSCRKIATRQHPDLHFMEPDGAFIKIDQVRELQRQLSYRPFEAPMKACIIDEADRLNPASGNALLKTLEEPPGNALIVLVTAKRGAMLPTILSRCQQLQFRALPQGVIEEYLRHAGNDEKTTRLAASLAGGSLGKAISFVQETILAERTGFLERLTSLSLRDITPIFAAAEEFAGDKEKALTLLDLLTTFLRDIMLLHRGSDDLVNGDLRPLLEREAARVTPEQLVKQISHVAEARHALMRNVNARLALDVLFIRLAHRQ